MSAASRVRARQRPWLAPVLAIVLPVLLIAGSIWYVGSSLLAGLCGSTEISRLTAPDSRHDAVLFEHDCGATTDFATHVSVLPTGAPLGREAGNAFAAGAGEAAHRAAWGGPPVALEWQSGGTLMIRYDDSAEVFQMADVVAGVVIHSGRMQ